MFEEMTWNEVHAALDYVFRYEIKERHYKGSVKLNDWIYPWKNLLPDQLKKVVSDLRKIKAGT